MPLYTERDVKVLGVYDGDTPKLDLDLFFGRFHFNGNCRLAEVWCPEIDEAGGPEARQFLIDLITYNGLWRKIYVQAHGVDPHFRPVITIFYKTATRVEVNVNKKMLESGFAKKISLKTQLTTIYKP